MAVAKKRDRTEYMRAYAAANKEKRFAQSKARHVENYDADIARGREYTAAHKAEKAEWGRQYYLDNRDAILAYNREQYANKKSDYLARIKLWQVSHPENVKAIGSRQRARRRGAPVNDLTAAQWDEIKAAFGGHCAYCAEAGHELTQDHIEPLSKGGSHSASNVVPACRSCNSGKGTMEAHEFFARRDAKARQ